MLRGQAPAIEWTAYTRPIERVTYTTLGFFSYCELTSRMARLGSIFLFGMDSVFPSGAAFSLTSQASKDGSAVLPGAEVEVRARQRDVVVRFNGAADAKAAFNEGHRLAQQGLDLLSILGRCDAVMQDAESEHLIWWSEC